MGSYTAIAEVSETLVELLRTEITERTDVVNIDRKEVALVSPDEVSADSDVRLAVYLYDVSENRVLRNSNREIHDDDTYDEPPLSLDLRYLLTAFPAQAGSDESTRTKDQQRVLGLAMQVLHDNAVVDQEELDGASGEMNLKVSLEEEGFDQMMNLWGTFGDTPFQPSVTYEVSPVLIDSRRSGDFERVRERGTDLERKPDPRKQDDESDSIFRS